MDSRIKEKKRLAGRIIKLLLKEFPEPKCALRFRTPFQLLVATVLSAQSTDAQVNRITPGLFRKYPSIKAFASAPVEEIQHAVSSVNFYRNKGKNIHNSARLVIERFGSRVPRTMQELTSLPGVARKTANIILSDGYGIIDGIAVDTHVLRLSGRLGLTAHGDPVKVERDLMEITRKQDWALLSHLLILHGRGTCKARNPVHEGCALEGLCPSTGK